MRLGHGSHVPAHHGHGRRGLLGGVALALALTSAVAIGGVSPASAHTALEYTVPADQEQAAEPVTQITVAFGDPVTIVGAGFEVFTPQEVIVEPNVFTEDGMVFLLQLDEPLAGGEAGVRYEVTAADGHVLEGGFRFTVPAAPAPTSAPVSAVATSVIAAGDGGEGGDGGGASTGLVIGVVAALAVAAAAFVLLRSRTNRPT